MTDVEPSRATNWSRSIDADDGRQWIGVAKAKGRIALRDSSYQDGRVFWLSTEPTIDFLMAVKRGDFDHLDPRLSETESIWHGPAASMAPPKEDAQAAQHSSVVERNILLIALIIALGIGVALIAGGVAVWAGLTLPIAVQKGGAALGVAIVAISALVGVAYRHKGR